MTNIKNLKWVLLISLTIITSFTVGSINASAHDPRYIDIKYYPNTDTPELSELSVYITHGVSDSDYHYTERILIEFYELPESIKQELPAIIISAHVYSTNPAQRSIVINNNFMEEGEYVLDGLILYEITTDGAIFNYQGTLFNYGVVSGWQ